VQLVGVEIQSALGAVLVWGELNTDQTPNYATINDSQTPGYVEINDSQTPGYVEIIAGRDAA
tara:strand:+ start:1214 stop:1399 length:186 start_codon:yes stop_codon:yes gene_type:complete